eukprot:TRINITY_DN5674_c0_g1_i3.p1 TRINITY_DN5674_c0_g1~~TRINITY_DN5674_c0_g1_i3.p1  ORF type:complete len:408 (-),score=48.92 TRINITY_DN5674_c0_g1_i3:191-1414(-)
MISIFQIFFFHGKHEIYLKNLSLTSMDIMEQYGLRVFRFCDQIAHIMPDVLMTLYLFFAKPEGMLTYGNVPPSKAQEQDNIKFIKEASGFQFLERNTNIEVFKELDPKTVKNGDFIFITRLDGLDPLEFWVYGPGPGHSTITLWGDDGELYILESQNANYWPKINIQKTKWKKWMKLANQAGYNVALLPLKKSLSEKFDAKAAWKWFEDLEGHPYGFHNYFFSWIDTEDQNFPPVCDVQFFAEVFALVGELHPKVFDSMLGQALNKRLNTTNLNMTEITLKLIEKDMSFGQLMMIPEDENWRYNDGISLVCSTFVIGVYKAAGMFDGLDIQITEFTPKDVIQLNFWDFDAKSKPKICQEADPDLPYCQLMGNVQMYFPNMNTIEPYSHMNERCASLPPQYLRLPENC